MLLSEPTSRNGVCRLANRKETGILARSCPARYRGPIRQPVGRSSLSPPSPRLKKRPLHADNYLALALPGLVRAPVPLSPKPEPWSAFREEAPTAAQDASCPVSPARFQVPSQEPAHDALAGALRFGLRRGEAGAPRPQSRALRGAVRESERGFVPRDAIRLDRPLCGRALDPRPSIPAVRHRCAAIRGADARA